MHSDLPLPIRAGIYYDAEEPKHRRYAVIKKTSAGWDGAQDAYFDNLPDAIHWFMGILKVEAKGGKE